MVSWRREWELVDEGVYRARRTDERLWQPARQRRVSRRRLLQGLVAGGGAALMFGGVPAGHAQGTPPAAVQELVVKPTPPERFFDYGTNDVMAEGLDDLKVRRPISVTKALAEDTLLVYAMNGNPLPPDHGFPIRLLTPGWIGVSNIKWLGRLEVSEEPLFSPWNTETYVLLGPDYQPNPPANGPMLSTQNPKSALELAQGAQLRAGLLLIKGRSWSPFGKIARVAYSLDQGQIWQQARLREPNIAGAWARWDFPWEAKPGQYTITVKAMDTAGNTQPGSVPWNEQGYLYNATVHHAVTVA
jgi:sulfane dehydrogenase subunit SoxC